MRCESRWRVIPPCLAGIAGAVLVLLPATIDARGSRSEWQIAAAPNVQASDTIVKMLGRPRYPGIATLVEELSIGVETGANEYMLSDVTKLFPLRDGSVLVVDRAGSRSGGSGSLAHAIRHYDATGKFIREFGRMGDGPGEFRIPESVAQLPNGTVIINDAVRNRLSFYSPSAQTQGHGMYGFNFSATIPRMESLVADTAGYLYRIIFPMAVRSINSSTEESLQRAYERTRIGSTVFDTILMPQFPSAPNPGEGFRNPNPDGTHRGPALSYWPYPMWRISPAGYMITALPTRYAIDLRIPAAAPGGSRDGRPVWKPGDRVVSIRRNVPPVPISATERAQIRARHSQTPTSPQSAWFRRGGDIPRVKPAFSQIRTGLDGRIWVQVAAPSVPRVPPLPLTGCPACTLTFRDSVLFDVLEPDGTYIGQVAFGGKLGATSGAMRGDHVWGVVRGPNDVPMVKRWRIAWR